jgi:hypothetical protein
LAAHQNPQQSFGHIFFLGLVQDLIRCFQWLLVHICALLFSRLFLLFLPLTRHSHPFECHPEVLQVPQQIQMRHSDGHLVPCGKCVMQSYDAALRFVQTADMGV